MIEQGDDRSSVVVVRDRVSELVAATVELRANGSKSTHRRAVWCLPGAWEETGHAALPRPSQIADAAHCLTSPNAAKIRYERPGVPTTRPPWPVDPEPAPPAGTTPPADPCSPPSRSDGSGDAKTTQPSLVHLGQSRLIRASR